jgi:hypothetical protein
MQAIINDIELDEKERQLERLAKRNLSLAPRSPAEELYIEAARIRQTSREEALYRFQALVDLFHGDRSEEAQRCVELAERQIDSIKKAIDLSDFSHRNKLKERIEYAANLATADPRLAQRILAALIYFYENKPWAEEEVAHASSLKADIDADIDAAIGGRVSAETERQYNGGRPQVVPPTVNDP